MLLVGEGTSLDSPVVLNPAVTIGEDDVADTSKEPGREGLETLADAGLFKGEEEIGVDDLSRKAPTPSMSMMGFSTEEREESFSPPFAFFIAEAVWEDSCCFCS